MTPNTAAIIVAGGRGLRFGGAVRKQYLLLKRKPIVWWSLQAFEKSPSIRWVILVVPADDIPDLRLKERTWRFHKLLQIVAGGASRADSVRQGLSALPEGCRYVAVHDAVRPLVTPRLIEETLRQARRFRAAIAASPSKDTVKLAGPSGCIQSTPSRDLVWLAQTPQTFERTLLERAHREGRRLAATDDAMLVERLGVKVKLVESSADNMKITTPMDLMIARAVIASEAKQSLKTDRHARPRRPRSR